MSNELSVIPSLAPSTMEQALAFANQMSQARLLPAHLQKSPADCLRVVLQAVRWQMDPFAVADKTSIIQNKLMYEGQLVSAVVNARGNLAKRLDYAYKGEGDARVLTVSGTVRGEAEARIIELPFALAKRINKNGQMQINPDQQAAYIGARIWARRHMPELMLGVYTPDEIDEDDAQNAEPKVASSDSPPPDRPAPKARAARGAAAAKEVIVPAEEQQQASTPEPTKAAAVAEEPKNVTPPTETKAATPAKQAEITQRALLAADETIAVEAMVTKFKVIVGTRLGAEHAYVTADVVGTEFSGEVDMTDAAVTPGKYFDGPIDVGTGVAVRSYSGNAIEQWQIKNPVRLTIRGKKFKGGHMRNVVDKIEVIGGAANTAESDV